jgi:hypothetical protein
MIYVRKAPGPQIAGGAATSPGKAINWGGEGTVNDAEASDASSSSISSSSSASEEKNKKLLSPGSPGATKVTNPFLQAAATTA